MGRDLPGSGATKQPDRKASTVSEPTACGDARPCPDPRYCDRWDGLVGLPGFHVLAVTAAVDGGLRVAVRSSWCGASAPGDARTPTAPLGDLPSSTPSWPGPGRC